MVAVTGVTIGTADTLGLEIYRLAKTLSVSSSVWDPSELVLRYEALKMASDGVVVFDDVIEARFLRLEVVDVGQGDEENSPVGAMRIKSSPARTLPAGATMF